MEAIWENVIHHQLEDIMGESRLLQKCFKVVITVLHSI